MCDTRTAVDRFNKVFNSQDFDAVTQLMADDCMFDRMSPAPNGVQYEGLESVRTVGEDFFRGSPDTQFDAEDIFATGDRCVVRWRNSFSGGHIRGVDIIRVRDGKVAEKFSYVKG